MAERIHNQVNAEAQPSVTSAPTGLLQRKCGCGKSAGLGKWGARDWGDETEAPPVLHDLLGSTLPAIQPKLKIGAPNDKYEQEADRVADQVMRMSEPRVQRQREVRINEDSKASKPIHSQASPLVQKQLELKDEEEAIQTKPFVGQAVFEVQRKCTDCEEDTIQPKLTTGSQILGFHSTDEMIRAKIERAKRSSGRPLYSTTRIFMESSFGHDFSKVRIHTDNTAAEAAQAINARAFTVDQHIIFGNGQYSPQTKKGKRLLAHELTHTIQQAPIFSDGVHPTNPIQRLSLDENEGEGEGVDESRKSDSCEGTSRDGPGEFRTIRNNTTVKNWEISNFDIEKNFLKPEHKKNINDKILTPAIIDLVKTKGWKLFVNGNASTTGGEKFNKLLSKARAICTTLFLNDGGMPIAGSKITGTGEAGARSRLLKEGATKIDQVEAPEDRSVQILLVATKAPIKIEPDPEPDCPNQEDLRRMFDVRDRECGVFIIGEVFSTDLACAAFNPLICVLLGAGGSVSEKTKKVAEACCTVIPEQPKAEEIQSKVNKCVIDFMVLWVDITWPDCNLTKSDLLQELEQWHKDLARASDKTKQ